MIFHVSLKQHVEFVEKTVYIQLYLDFSSDMCVVRGVNIVYPVIGKPVGENARIVEAKYIKMCSAKVTKNQIL